MVANGFHLAAIFHEELFGHAQPDFTRALYCLSHVAHVDECLHVQAILNEFNSLAADVRLHLFAGLLISKQVLHIRFSDL
ncbi:hypothetical protein D3C81_1926610 [compost metagenome]